MNRNAAATASAGPAVKPFAGRRTRCTNKLVYPCRVEGWLNVCDRDLQIGHRPANVVKDKKLNFITWEPYFCVLLQDEQTLTAYRSEELSIFPGTALRTITHAFKNPIEPSINVLGSSSDAFDSQINSIKPIHQYVKMSTHDEDLVPRTYSYHPMDSIYDSEYTSVQKIPKLMPENIYDYKYIASPPINYQPQPLIPESDVAFNLFAIRKASVFSYKSPNLNLNSNILSSIFVDPKSAETDSEISKVSSPSVTILELLPEKSEHESTTATTEDPYEIKSYIEKVLTIKPFSVESESKYDAETPIENESNVLEENSSENQSYSITTEDESNALTTEDEPNVVTTEDDSNDIPTEDESNSFTTEDESNSFTTEENQTVEDDDSQTSTTQETTTVSRIDDVLNDNWFNTKSEEDSELKLKEIIDRYQKLREQMKPLFTTTVDFKSEQSSSASDEKQVQTVLSDVILRLPGNEETETSAEYE